PLPAPKSFAPFPFLARRFFFVVGSVCSSIEIGSSEKVSLRSLLIEIYLVENTLMAAPVNNKFGIPLTSRPTATLAVAAEMSGVSIALIYRLMKEGKVKRYKVGRRTLVDIPSLLRTIGWEEEPRHSNSIDEANTLDLVNR